MYGNCFVFFSFEETMILFCNRKLYPCNLFIMNTKYIIDELKSNKIVFKVILENLDEKVYRWKFAPEKWNILEVLGHLHDEEREDFRARVKHTLENPELPLS